MTTIVPTPGMVAICPAVNVPVTPKTVNCVTVIGLPSGSESFVKTFPEIGVSSGVTKLSSFTVIGESLTAVTVIANVPVSVPPSPSLMVYVITGTVPFQLAFGVKTYVPFALTTIVPTPGMVAVVPAG